MSISEQSLQAKAPVKRMVFLVAVVWAASAPVAEGVFRLLGERTTTDLAGLYQSFGDGGYRLRPNVNGTADSLQGRYSVVTDTLGLRCASTRRPYTTDEPDILALGDSQAFGAGLNFEETVVGQLAARAATAGLRLENAAVGGHYLANQFELARWLYSRGLRPRRILLFLSPYLIASAGKYNRVSVGSDGRLYDRGHKPGVTSWFKRNTVTYGRVRNAINHIHPLTKSDLTPLAVKIYLKQYEQGYRENTLLSVRELLEWAADHGIELQLAYTPLAVEVAFDPVRQAAAANRDELDPNAPYLAAQAVAAELGIELYDLRRTLAALSAGGHGLTLPSDSHYDARTSAACADQLWAAMSGSADLRSSASAGPSDSSAAGTHKRRNLSSANHAHRD